MTTLADRRLELPLQGRLRFGVGALATLPDVVAELAGQRAFIVTDPGVVASGVVDRASERLVAAGLPVDVYAEVDPNPGTGCIERGSARLAEVGTAATVVVAIGGGSAMDVAKVVALHAVNGGDVLALGYHRDDLLPGAVVLAVPTTAGTGAETNTYGVITDATLERKTYVGHPSVRPAWTILDPELTVGLPPAATAATGIDAMTHAIESHLSANPNPYAEALALQVARVAADWLPRAVADGTDLEARSQMLLASHLAGLAQASGTGVGLVHALGHAIGTRGQLAHGTALSVVLPEVLDFYLAEPGLRERELARFGVAMGAARPNEPEVEAALAAIWTLRAMLDQLGQRPSLRDLGLEDADLSLIADDALADAAIRNSPRLASRDEALAILTAALVREPVV